MAETMTFFNRYYRQAQTTIRRLLPAKLLGQIFFWFILAQPILDLYFLFDTGKNIPLQISVSTLVRLAFAGLAAVALLAYDRKDSFPFRRFIFSYLVFWLTYSLAHHIYSLVVIGGEGYSLGIETFYLVRLVVPLLVLGLSMVTKFASNTREFLLRSLIATIAGSIVALNLLGYSLGTYTHEVTSMTVFDWTGDSFLETATKGFFMYGNQVSALLLLLSLLLLAVFIKNPTVKDFTLLFLAVLASVMLGTRVAIFGTLFSVALALVSYLVYHKKPKLATIASLLVLILGLFCLYPFSPSFNRSETNKLITARELLKSEKVKNALVVLSEIEKGGSEEELKTFLIENYQLFSINKETIMERYSYRDYAKFWANMFREPLPCRKDNRCIQAKIAGSRLSDDKKNLFSFRLLGLLFGSGYTRADSAFSIERDFVSHFYNLGLLGIVLFLLPYLVVLVVLIISALALGLFTRKLAVLDRLIPIAASFVLVMAAFLSGNVFDSLFVMIIFSFLLGQFYQDAISLTSSQLRKGDYFDKMFKGSRAAFIDRLEAKIQDLATVLVVTANPETFERASREKVFRQILLDDRVEMVADGIGVLKAGRWLGYDIKERIAGVDIAEELLKVANQQKLKISVLGAKPEIIKDFADVLSKKYPNIVAGDLIHGYNQDKDADMKKIVKGQPDILLVALGMGDQEKLIFKHLDELKHCICVGVGGSIDVLSGNVQRAPEIFIKLNLEWLYRIAKEPKRFRRFYDNNFKFMLKALLAKFSLEQIN